MAYLSTHIDASLLSRFGTQLQAAVRSFGGGPQPMRNALKQAGAVYMGFTRQRFEAFSRGGGDWDPLAPSTLKGRRKGRRTQGRRRSEQATRILEARGVSNAGDAAILRDSGILFNSITTFEREDIAGGIRVGSGVQYGKFHDEGGKNGRPPKRQIFVDPDPKTQALIQRALETGLQGTVKLLGGGA